jgi:MFS family permease
MECGYNYTSVYKYPIESITIFPIQKNIFLFCFLQYVTTVCVGSLIWLIESYDGYLAIRILNFNRTISKPSILDYIKEDDMFPQVFYFSYAMFLQSLTFYLYFFYKSYNNVKRKNLYFGKMRNVVAISLLFTFQFLAWYYIFVLNNLSMVFLNIAFLISICSPFLNYNIIRKHREIINIINEGENNEELLQYVENPLNSHPNIFL